MHIARLTVRNFKSFPVATFHFNTDVNILTGVNNSGKTSVLEALALWEECLRATLYQAKMPRKARQIAGGQFLLGDVYRSSDMIQSVRSLDYGDIFHNLDTNNVIELGCTLAEGADRIAISFSIRWAHGWNYRITHLPGSNFDFALFNSFFKRLPDTFNISYTSPVATLLTEEEFETPPKIRAAIRSRNAISVLRNRIYRLRSDVANLTRFEDFQNRVSYVLTGASGNVALQCHGDIRTDVQLRVTVQLGPRDIEKDISLLGSGTLQIIEVLLSLFEGGAGQPRSNDLNVVLLDEPDSHIHRDIQRRLLEVLQQHTSDTQIFLTTQSESLIRSARPRWLFHLEPGASKDYRPVTTDEPLQRKLGLQPSRQIKILRSLGSETALDFLNALEAQKLVLVEGEDDARYLEMILNRKYINKSTDAMFWSFRGVANIFEKLPIYREVFQQFKNSKTLWDKAVLLFDRDDFTDGQRVSLATELTSKLQIPVYIWASYTIESTILTDVAKFKLLVGDLMRKEGHRVDQAALEVSLDRIINDEVTRQTARVQQDRVFLQGLFERLRDKREKLKDHYGIKGIVPTDGSIQPEYQQDALTALQQGQIAHLANKDDVAAIVERAHQDLGVPFQPTGLFARLIDAITPATWFSEWDEICKRVL